MTQKRVAGWTAVAGKARTRAADDLDEPGLRVVEAQLVIVPSRQQQGAVGQRQEMGRVIEVDLGAGRAGRYLIGIRRRGHRRRSPANDGDESALRGHAAHAVVIPVEEVGTQGGEG